MDGLVTYYVIIPLISRSKARKWERAMVYFRSGSACGKFSLVIFMS